MLGGIKTIVYFIKVWCSIALIPSPKLPSSQLMVKLLSQQTNEIDSRH